MSRVCSYNRQRGVSLVLVLFLLTVVTVMVVSMANLSTGQHMGSLYSARGAQAYFAARAGVDYAISRINSGAGCAGVGDLPDIGGTGYDVQVTCCQGAFDAAWNCIPEPMGGFNEGNPVPYSIYSIRSVATDGGFQVPDVVTREVRATIKNP